LQGGESDIRNNACRELTHYRGEPDPFKGGVPSQKVRDMAREAIDALFNDNNYAEQASAPAPSLTVRMTPSEAAHRLPAVYEDGDAAFWLCQLHGRHLQMLAQVALDAHLARMKHMVGHEVAPPSHQMLLLLAMLL